LIAFFLFFAGEFIFSQNSNVQQGGAGAEFTRSSIPTELLRPRRDESPRYPVDTVIGPLGQGQSPKEAWLFARDVAAALLAGNPGAASLSFMNKVFLESYMSALGVISPRTFRLGSGRTEDDGSVSFLVRFIGREQGITGELFIRLEERQTPVPQPAKNTAQAAEAGGTEQPAEIAEQAVQSVESVPLTETVPEEPLSAPAAEKQPPKLVWVFEDLILEEARSREAENEEGKHRFDFSPYERFF
jgi:hypothetical protein